MSGSPVVPPALARNAVEVGGAAGRRWLAALPGLLAGVQRRWGLTLGAPFVMSYHWVVRAQSVEHGPVVLKLGPPGAEHLRREVAALRAYRGRGAVRLLAHDEARGALLLERAEPGTPARELVPDRDADATAATLDVLRQLHRAPVPAESRPRAGARPGPPVRTAGAALPELRTMGADLARHLDRCPGDDPLPRVLVQRAAELLDELWATTSHHVVLHGDLHHDNVLRRAGPSGTPGWVAIDPHGWIGDPGFDAGPLLYNPDPDRLDESLLALVPTRVEQLAASLGIAAERVAAWGFVAAVLSEVWSAETPGHRGARPLAVARMLARSLP